MYRIFFKQNLYFGEKLIHRRGQFEDIFPTKDHKNVLICVNGLGSRNENSSIITSSISDLNVLNNK